MPGFESKNIEPVAAEEPKQPTWVLTEAEHAAVEKEVGPTLAEKRENVLAGTAAWLSDQAKHHEKMATGGYFIGAMSAGMYAMSLMPTINQGLIGHNTGIALAVGAIAGFASMIYNSIQTKKAEKQGAEEQEVIDRADYESKYTTEASRAEHTQERREVITRGVVNAREEKQ